MHTARAPIASALTMSVPRRKPESTSTGRRPSTASTISGRASMVERPMSSSRPPWFDTMMPSSPLSTARIASSGVIRPFSTSLVFTVSRRRLMKSQVRLVAPVRIDAGDVEPVEVGLALHEARQPQRMALRAVALVGAPQAHVGLPVLPRQHVDRDDDGLGAGLLGAPGQRLGHLPTCWWGRAGTRRAGRALRSPARSRSWPRSTGSAGGCPAGGARDGKLAVLMEGAVGSGRRHHDRASVGAAEQLQAEVELRDVDQPPRPQLELLEAVAVGAQRHLVVDAGRHVAEMGRRHVLVHHRFEVEDVERFARRWRSACRACAAPRPSDRAGAAPAPGDRSRQQRTGRKEFQETAAAEFIVFRTAHPARS